MAVHCDVCGTRIFSAAENEGSFLTTPDFKSASPFGGTRIDNTCEDCGYELRVAVTEAAGEIMKAITPDEVGPAHAKTIPDDVIASFNELIVQNWDGEATAVVKQDAVIALILAKMPSASREELFAKRWLDIEPIFELAGWRVHYDKPGYNENYEAFFEFTRRNKRGR